MALSNFIERQKSIFGTNHVGFYFLELTAQRLFFTCKPGNPDQSHEKMQFFLNKLLKPHVCRQAMYSTIDLLEAIYFHFVYPH